MTDFRRSIKEAADEAILSESIKSLQAEVNAEKIARHKLAATAAQGMPEHWDDAIKSLDDQHITTHADVQRFMGDEIDALRACAISRDARIAELEAELSASRAEVERLRFALKGLHDDNMDYLTINKLGGAHNHWMKIARDALSATKEPR